jgi:hypothetical protein
VHTATDRGSDGAPDIWSHCGPNQCADALSDGHPNRDADGHAHCYADGYAHYHAQRYAECHAHSHTNGRADSHTDGGANTLAHSIPNDVTHAKPDSRWRPVQPFSGLWSGAILRCESQHAVGRLPLLCLRTVQSGQQRVHGGRVFVSDGVHGLWDRAVCIELG